MKTSPAKIQYRWKGIYFIIFMEKERGVTIEPSWHLMLMFEMHYCWYRASIYCFISNILPVQIRKTIARLSSSPAPSDYLQSYPAWSSSVTKIQQRKCHTHDGIICEVLAHMCQYEEGQDWLSLFLATACTVASSYHQNLQFLPITWTKIMQENLTVSPIARFLFFIISSAWLCQQS